MYELIEEFSFFVERSNDAMENNSTRFEWEFSKEMPKSCEERWSDRVNWLVEEVSLSSFVFDRMILFDSMNAEKSDKLDDDVCDVK